MFKCKYTGKKREGNRKKKFGRLEIRTTNRLHVNHVHV